MREQTSYFLTKITLQYARDQLGQKHSHSCDGVYFRQKTSDAERAM